jgi:putative addiction module CopG family antidote
MAEACQKTDWQVHAFCLMRNHYHSLALCVLPMSWRLGRPAERSGFDSRLRNQFWSNKPCYLLLSGYPEDMNVSLTDELETVIQEKVKSGLYNNASEVVRDALRRAFCQPQSLNPDEDTPELAALIREGINSRHAPHRKGDVRRLLDRSRQRSRK